MEKTIFETKEQYQEMCSNFKKWYNEEGNKEKLRAEDFALYAVLRGKSWKTCFTPNTAEEKLESIQRYLNKTKYQYLFLAPYGNTITEEMINSIREAGIEKW